MNYVTEKEKPNENSTVGDRIAYIRTINGLSQKRLAEMIGRKREEITMWEKGARAIDIYTLKNVAQTLEVSTDYLLGLTEFESLKDDYKIINNVTALDIDTIKVLNEFKILNLEEKLDFINFLIKQEEICPINEFRFSATIEEEEKSLEKAEKSFQEQQDKWYSEHIPIISELQNHYSLEIPHGKLYITRDGIKEEKDFKSEFQKIRQVKGEFDIEELENTSFIFKLQDKINKSKKIFKERRNNKN